MCRYYTRYMSLGLTPRHNDFRWVGCPPWHRGVASRHPHRLLSPPGLHPTRRSARSPSRTRSVALDGPPASLAVAAVAHAPGAAVLSRGTLGPRPGARAQLRRPRRSPSPPLVGVDAAGPCGAGRSRSLMPPGDGGGVGAPSWRPHKAGARGPTDRREARPRARLRRAGALPPGAVPAVAAAALRTLRRARAETLRELQAAQRRRQAFLRRHDSRSTERAPWRPASLRGRSAGVWPSPAPPLGVPADVPSVTAPAPGPRGAALGDLTRGAQPRPRRPELGLPPAASARVGRRQPGRLTPTGPPPARRAWGAGAWASRSPATVRRHLPWPLAQLPTALQALSGPAQGRLGPRDRQRRAPGQPAQPVAVALAGACRAGLEH
jgi:transposase